MSRMQELIEAGLFGRGLIHVNNQVLIKRYNQCLATMGIQKTGLKAFSIDRMGWSPEIAAERGDDYYLSHGDANPLAIILSPEQIAAPIYFPMHSFDWELMRVWYKARRSQIADITKDSAIWLDIDQEVDVYQLPSDLTMVKEVIVRAATPDNLIERARVQDGLVKRWLSEPNALFDKDLLSALEKTAKDDGDYRHRQMIIRDLQYSNLRDFYSPCFGGSFVLRSRNEQSLVLVCDEQWVDEENGVYLADSKILSKLVNLGYLETDVDWWQHHLYRLKVVAESFLVDVLEKKRPRINYTKLNKAKLKQLVQKYKDDLGDYTSLMRAYKSLKAGKMPKVSGPIAQHLLHPNDQLPAASREVLWQLLTYIRGGRFVPLLYRHQKSDFVMAYTKQWKKPKRTWALSRVQEFYDVASKSSGLEL